MSHFTVLVIGPKTDEELQSALAPYEEWGCRGVNPITEPDDPISPYLVFKDTTDEIKDEYKNLENKTTTFEEYAREDGYLQHPKDSNVWGYWNNPNGYWDWWVVGGRWSGRLINKNIQESTNIDDDRRWDEDVASGRRVNYLRVGDAYLGKNDKWYEKALLEWEYNVERVPKEYFEIDEKDIDKLREVWREYEATIPEDIREKLGFLLYMPSYYTERYNSAEEYANCRSTFTTHAVITQDGKWHHIGKMGWFGANDEDNGPRSEVLWALSYYDRFIKDLEPDTVLTIVDCHV